MTISKVSKLAGRWGAVVALVAAALVLGGCKGGPKFTDVPGFEAGATGAATAAPVLSGPDHVAAPVVAGPDHAAPAPVTSGPDHATAAPVVTQVSNPPAASKAAPKPDEAVITLNTIQVNDLLSITFFDLAVNIPPMDQQVKEDGTITLIQNQKFDAAGKTRGQLEAEIRKRYVPDFFPTMTVSVAKKQDQFYYVGGEVKLPGRQIYISRVRVLGAIKSAGDFTDFAKRTGIELTRADGRKYTINAKKAQQDPKLDLEVLPGDDIRVPRRINPFSH